MTVQYQVELEKVDEEIVRGIIFYCENDVRTVHNIFETHIDSPNWFINEMASWLDKPNCRFSPRQQPFNVGKAKTNKGLVKKFFENFK